MEGAAQPTRGGLNTDPKGTGRTAWQYLASIWGDCLSLFGQDARFDGASFRNLLTDGIRWLDVRQPQIASRTWDSYAHDGNQITLGEAFTGGASAITIMGTQYVAVGPNYFTDNTQTQQIAIAVHEALHITMNMDDTELGGWLMNFGFKPSSSFSSHEITNWIVGTKDHMSTIGGGCKNP